MTPSPPDSVTLNDSIEGGVGIRDLFGVPSGVEASVCSDIANRQRKGIAKYGMTVADNPLPLRDWLQHAYEETLDKAIYLKRAIQELPDEPLQECSNRQPESTGELGGSPEVGSNYRWCAWCGEMADHGSGSCPDMQRRTASQIPPNIKPMEG